MNKTNYYKIESPSGKFIRYAIRRGIYLVITPSFDPYRYIDFAENYITEISEVERMEVINVYDDNTGYYIFKLKKNYNIEWFLNGIQLQFEAYFTDKATCDHD